MAGFKTHITVSSGIGVGYAAIGYLQWHLPIEVSILGGGLCGLAGMLPDLDSGSGRPLREMTTFAAAVAPLLMIDRFQHMGMSPSAMVLTGAIIYATVRFGAAALLRRFTVHRGMFHSLPAMIITGLIGFLLCMCEDTSARYYKSGALVLGFFSHLLLDELYSIEWYRGRIRFKKSFGTAIKIWGKRLVPNLVTYTNVVLLIMLAYGDTRWMDTIQDNGGHYHDSARDLLVRNWPW